MAGDDQPFYQGNVVIVTDNVSVYANLLAKPGAVRYRCANDNGTDTRKASTEKHPFG